MQTKTIDKLEDLINEKWNFNKKKFKLEKSYMVGATVVLHMLNNKENTNGEEEDKPVFWVNEKNYKELEFYGLKVILNEKPKLTREEKVFLELLEDNYVYIARSQDSSLSLFNDEPRQASEDWYISIDECEDDDYGILLLRQTFPFITWESGKAWSKAELMELKVID